MCSSDLDVVQRIQQRRPRRRLGHRFLRGDHGRGEHGQRRRGDGQGVEHSLDARANRCWRGSPSAVHQRLQLHSNARADDLVVEHWLREQHLQHGYEHGSAQTRWHRRHLVPDGHLLRASGLRQAVPCSGLLRSRGQHHLRRRRRQSFSDGKFGRCR